MSGSLPARMRTPSVHKRSASALNAALLAGICLLARPAAAQLGDLGGRGQGGGGGLGGGLPYTGGILPNVGGSANVNDLRPQLERYFRTSLLPATAPAWVIEPSMSVDVGATDNAQRVKSPRRGDIFTSLTPSVVVTGDTAHIRTNLSYSPTAQIYATQGSQTQFSQYANGQSFITIVPDALFLDLRGSITQTSRTGSGFNDARTQSTSTYNRQNQVQTTAFSFTPYAEHRFGGWGTARVGYSYSKTLQDSADGQNNGINNNGINNNGINNGLDPLTSPGYGTLGNLSTQRERVSFASGENLGRFNDLAVLEAYQYSGGGSYSNSHRNQFSNEVGFALTRRITLLAGFGYQDISYGGSPPVRVNEPTWNFGGRYSPSEDSTVTILYGRRDGDTSASADAQFAPTSRTRVFLRYSTGITSDIEEAQNLLATTSVGPGGLVVDSTTGAPVGGGGSFGIQNGIYRVKRLSASGLLLAVRDSYSLTLTSEDRTTLSNTSSFFSNGTIPAGTSSTSLSVSLGWQHDLLPDLTSSVSLQYGQSDNTSQLVNGTSGKQTTISATASLNKQFTATLSGSLRYTFSNRSGGQGGNFSGLNTSNFTENVLTVGLRKSF